MPELDNETQPVDIVDEMRRSYLDYAMSVIVGRALPDVRDGLKPVHRRTLYAMQVLNSQWDKAYKKSARIVGDVIGKYHPHGDSAVYDTIVRMAQDFSMRCPLVDGQGNFGSLDGDSPAAMRYTEVRMSRIASVLLADMEHDTVDMVPNYDGSERMPDVLPAGFPNLLVNGSSGIAVGVATNIPPHNLSEVISGCLALIDDPEIDVLGLMQHIPGPDFPTGAIINGREGILAAYREGRGRVVMRARAEVESVSGRERIAITEIPYQLNKVRMIQRIAELVKEGVLSGISDLRDESNKDGVRVVIELKRAAAAEVVLNNLYQRTDLQKSFGVNMVALVQGRPRTLSLKEALEAFVRHRREVVTRRTLCLLDKAIERGHALEGLAVALANLDEVIGLIRRSANTGEAQEALMARSWPLGDVVMELLERAGAEACRPRDMAPGLGLVGDGYRLSLDQVKALLDLRLHRLVALERNKLSTEYAKKLEEISGFNAILLDPDRLTAVIREELEAVREAFAEPRRSEIIDAERDFEDEDLIPEETQVVTVSDDGYAKRQPLADFGLQYRGGRGKKAAAVKESDALGEMLVGSTHDTMLCFSDHGRLYWLKTYRLPSVGRAGRGRPLVNLLPLVDGERITATLLVRDYDLDSSVVMASARGVIKKTALTHFAKPRSRGVIAVRLDAGDHLIGAALTRAGDDVMLFSNAGRVVRFPESALRRMGRVSRGVRGMRLRADDDEIIALLVPQPGDDVLLASGNGYGKRVALNAFTAKSRGLLGVIGMRKTERNGPLVAAVLVAADDEALMISDAGILVRLRADQVSLQRPYAHGVLLLRLSSGAQLQRVRRLPHELAAGVMTPDAELGDPEAGDPEAGDPEAGDPEVGDPEVGDPELDDPDAGAADGDGAEAT